MIRTRLLGGDPATGPLDALRILAASPVDELPRAVLVHTPQARGNPFADLLYRDLADAGVVVVPAVDVAAAAELAVRLRELTGGAVACVVHVHWLHRVTATARDDAAAQLRVDAALDALRTARSTGARLLWTVHNLAPHRSRHPAAEQRLRREIAAFADLVHVLDPGTVTRLAEGGSGDGVTLDPVRVREVAHPSYLGAYPDTVTRTRARQQLGLPSGAVVLTALGRIQAYKGLDVLADAFAGLLAIRSPADPPLRLVVAGGVDGVGPGPVRPVPGPADPAIGALLTRLADVPEVLCLPVPVADDQVQVVMRAADVSVVPNLAPLNSGAQLLALGFDVPVVTTGRVPDGAGWGVAVPPGDATALTAALRQAVERFTGSGAPAARRAAREAARAVAPDVVGPRFAELVRELLDQPAGSPRPTSTGTPTGSRP